ncbi:MAG TPA: type I restriction enzyme HsdR N-terminal domain-containing protein [Phnomibacter sp.]|nr:type I restriction enzyme HsdR N-terminal domain-containing protein [Phnomibacter sp.]
MQVHFPPPQFKLRHQARGTELFDSWRHKWVLLTPEEWVRQNLAAWLQEVQGVPAAMIAMERKITVGDRSRRFDIVVYSAGFKPWMLVECKRPEVPLTDAVMNQALAYTSVLQVPYLMLSNGLQHFCWHLARPHPLLLINFPEYNI